MNRLNQNARGKIGYTYSPMVNSNIGIQNVPSHYSAGVMRQSDMSGEGIMDIARSLYEKGKTAASYLYDNRDKIIRGAEIASTAYSGPIGTAVKNILPDSDENARPSYVGERHGILKLPNGKYGTANFLGPGTQIVKRLRRGDPPRTESDKVAQRHDVDYALAAGLENKQAQAKAIRTADKRMVNSLGRISKAGTDSAHNIFLGKRLIQGKMAAEDVGLLARDKFSGDLEKISTKDRILLMSKSTELGQQGYGMLPGEALKMKLMKSMKKKKGSGLKLPGSGLKLPGGKYQKGGFFFLLAPLIALAAEAVSGITVASVGSAVATGALGAAAGVATKKILGSGKMKGHGVKDVAQKVATVLKKNREKLISIAKQTGVRPEDLPKQVLDKAQKALDMLQKIGKPTKEGLLKIVKMLLPHVKSVFKSKVERKMGGSGLGLAGSGLGLAGKGDFDSKVLSAVSEAL